MVKRSGMKSFRFITALLWITSGLIWAQEAEEVPFLQKRLITPKNFYTFLELNQGELTNNAQAKTTPEMSDKEHENAVNNYYKTAITAACKKKRETLQDKIEEATRQLQYVEELKKEVREFEILQLRFDLQITTNICPILLDPKKRAQYDNRLGKASDDEEFFNETQQRIDEALLLVPSQKVILSTIIGEVLADIIKDVPGPAFKIFNQDMALRSISVLPMPYGPEVRYGIGFSGLMAIGQFEVRVSVYIIQNIYGEKKVSISVELPEHYKLSDLIPSITILDTFSFVRGKIVLANFEGIDNEGFSFQKGFNYIAVVDLKGPLATLNVLKEQSAKLKSIVFDAKPIVLHGVINPYDIPKTSFSMKVPFYMGIDLRKISYVPSALSNVINQITSDELNLTVSPFKRGIRVNPGDLQPVASLRFKIKAENGVRILLSTQQDPIRLVMLGILEPASLKHPQGYLSLGGGLRTMLEFDWIALGDAGAQVDFDPALMTLLRKGGYTLPFTGLFLKGHVDLGKPGASRAQLKAAGGFRAMTQKGKEQLAKEPEKKGWQKGQQFVESLRQQREEIVHRLPVEFLLDVSGENIRFADLINYATWLAAKKGFIQKEISVSAIPSITFHKVQGHLALVDTRIADTEYKAGVGVQLETEIWSKKAGVRVHINDAFRLNGWGYLPYLTITAKGKEVFSLQGLAEDKGPRVNFSFDPREPKKGIFTVDGTMAIPALGLRQMINFKWYHWWLLADFESKFAGFSVLFGIRMNLKAKPPARSLFVKEQQDQEDQEDQEVWREMTQQEQEKYQDFEKWRQLYVKFGFKDDFAAFLNERLKPALESLKEKSIANLDKLALFFAAQHEQGTQAAQQEKERVAQEINVLEQNILDLKKECAQTSGTQKIRCQASIAAKQAMLQVKKFYRNALMKPLKAVLRKPIDIARRITQAKILRRATESILNGVSKGLEFIASGIQILHIKEAIGEYSYRDMIDLKLPRLIRLEIKLSLVETTTFTLEDIQFDFKNPQASVAQIIFSITQSFVASQNEKAARYMERVAALS